MSPSIHRRHRAWHLLCLVAGLAFSAPTRADDGPPVALPSSSSASEQAACPPAWGDEISTFRHERRWIDAITWSGSLVVPNSGLNFTLLQNGGGAEIDAIIPCRLPAPSLLNNDESAEFNVKFGFAGQSFAGRTNVALVQTGVGSFQLVDARMYEMTLGIGYEAHRNLCEGFAATGRIGTDLLIGGVSSKINAIAANPALIQVPIDHPLTDDFLWGGQAEIRLGLIGPRGWGVSGGCVYGANRTAAISGSDHGSTSISAELVIEKRFGTY